MINFLKYFYNIYIDNVNTHENYYSFYYHDNLYFICKNIRSIEELKDIIDICNELKSKGLLCNEIIVNKFSNIISLYEEKEYILIRINGSSTKELDINDMISINKKFYLNKENSKLYRNNWSTLWESKIDYIEYQYKELGLNKRIIKDSILYYIGLAENAISVVNINHIKNLNANENIVLSHKRINYPNLEIDYLNPMNFIFDIEVRDIAEYIKSIYFFLDEEMALEEIKKYIYNNKLNNYSANMLFARLLYPSYYFDIYENVIENRDEEENLIPIINKAEGFEKLLKKVYIELSKYYNIEYVEWLIKKEL